MNLKPLGANKTELTMNKNGNCIRVLFSYATPVAVKILTENGLEHYQTETHYSKTTTKHISMWVDKFLPKDQIKKRPQSFFDELVA